jgi:hypothetical protein
VKKVHDKRHSTTLLFVVLEVVVTETVPEGGLSSAAAEVTPKRTGKSITTTSVRLRVLCLVVIGLAPQMVCPSLDFKATAMPAGGEEKQAVSQVFLYSIIAWSVGNCPHYCRVLPTVPSTFHKIFLRRIVRFRGIR